MSIPDDVDPDALITRLAGPLPPSAREAFRRAAEEALARIPCTGEGIVYRTVAALQREYFTAPNARNTPHHMTRGSKLANGPPLEYGGDQRRVRYHRLKPPVR
jgi:hypothetical protein